MKKVLLFILFLALYLKGYNQILSGIFGEKDRILSFKATELLVMSTSHHISTLPSVKTDFNIGVNTFSDKITLSTGNGLELKIKKISMDFPENDGLKSYLCHAIDSNGNECKIQFNYNKNNGNREIVLWYEPVLLMYVIKEH